MKFLFTFEFDLLVIEDYCWIMPDLSVFGAVKSEILIEFEILFVVLLFAG